MESILSVFKSSFNSLLPVIHDWLAIIGILLILLVCFRCFTSPFNVSFSMIRRAKLIVSRTLERKDCMFSVFEKKKLRRNLTSSLRLVDASLYDDTSSGELKAAKEIITRLFLLMDAYEKAVMNESERNRRAVIKSVLKNLDAYLELPKVKKFGYRR